MFVIFRHIFSSNSTEENIWVSVDQVRKMRRSLKQEQENAVTGAFGMIFPNSETFIPQILAL